ncbi:MAG: hypothetical protein ACFB0B_01835 [Thermonemataceae bacterium]
MSKVALRSIKVDGKYYLWKREHQHLDEFIYAKCVEKVTIFLKGYKKSPLYLLFREEDNPLLETDNKQVKWCVGYPDAGVIWSSVPDSVETITYINLNRPAVIAALIRFFMKEKWQPASTSRPLKIEQALVWLSKIALPEGY